MEIEIKSDGGRVSAQLDRMGAALLDLRPALKNVAAEIDRRTALSLETSRRQDGVPFPDLAESTKLARLRQRKGAYAKATRGPKATKKQLRMEARAARSRSIYVRMGGRLVRKERLSGARAQVSAQLKAALAGANFKPLVNTGRGRNSANARVTGRDTVRWSVVQYMVPHIGGAANGRPPMRNFSVFRQVGSGYELRPEMSEFMRAAIQRHVMGASAGGAP